MPPSKVPSNALIGFDDDMLTVVRDLACGHLYAELGADSKNWDATGRAEVGPVWNLGVDLVPYGVPRAALGRLGDLVEAVGSGWRITAKGRAFYAAAREDIRHNARLVDAQLDRSTPPDLDLTWRRGHYGAAVLVDHRPCVYEGRYREDCDAFAYAVRDLQLGGHAAEAVVAVLAPSRLAPLVEALDPLEALCRLEHRQALVIRDGAALHRLKEAGYTGFLARYSTRDLSLGPVHRAAMGRLEVAMTSAHKGTVWQEHPEDGRLRIGRVSLSRQGWVGHGVRRWTGADGARESWSSSGYARPTVEEAALEAWQTAKGYGAGPHRPFEEVTVTPVAAPIAAPGPGR